MVSSDVPRLVADASWLPHRYDPPSDSFQFREVPRARHGKVPFLTDEYLGNEGAFCAVPRAAAMASAPGPAPLHFIFHSAFCASTMLVRALDVPGSASGLSEPVVLNDLVGWRRRGAKPEDHQTILRDTLHLLSRPFESGEAMVIKPSNVFNGLAIDALAIRPESRAILLHAPLPEFLLSVARKGLWCRLWARELLEGLLQEGWINLGFEPRDYFRQSDLQVAAAGWLAQQALFNHIATRTAPDRVRTLDSERLTAAPAESVAAAAAFLGLKADAAEAYAAHPAVARNSKSGAKFARGERQEDQVRARAAYGEEIDKVVTWATAVADHAKVPLTLPNALGGR
jgi:hypothetical protein